MNCCNCTGEKELENFKIENRGYDSRFDGDIFSLSFCKLCLKELNIDRVWFDNEHCYQIKNDTIICLYENELLQLFNKLPLKTKEMINNCYNVHYEFAKTYNECA